jgi:hypothetical protein
MVLRNRASNLAPNGVCTYTSRSYRAGRAKLLDEVLRNRAKLSYCYRSSVMRTSIVTKASVMRTSITRCVICVSS